MRKKNKKEDDKYHHGNLRTALINAGIDIIDKKGIGALSLRACAATAGVSHAAPQYHFGNINNLFTAIAVVANEKFHDFLQGEAEKCDSDPVLQARCMIRAYLKFARENPGLFRLIFNTNDLDIENEDLAAAISNNYELHHAILQKLMPYLRDDIDITEQSLALLLWSFVHGYTCLVQDGQFKSYAGNLDEYIAFMPDILTPFLKVEETVKA